MPLDRASEDPVLARVNGILELADLPGLAPHQLADPTMRVTERADTEQPHWSRGKRGAVGAQEPGRARDRALVVDAAAENDRVVSARSSTSSTGRASARAPAFASLVAIRSATPLAVLGYWDFDIDLEFSGRLYGDEGQIVAGQAAAGSRAAARRRVTSLSMTRRAARSGGGAWGWSPAMSGRRRRSCTLV